MIKGSIDTLYKQQKQIQKYNDDNTTANYTEEVHASAKNYDLADRVTKRIGVSPLANSVLIKNEKMQGELGRLSDLAGIPGLSDSEKFDVYRQTADKFGEPKREELKNSKFAERRERKS